MIKLVLTVLVVISMAAFARPQLSEAEIINFSLEESKDNSETIYEMAIPFSKNGFDQVFLEIEKAKGAVKISDSRYDIKPYMESVGAEFGPEGVAIAEKDKQLLYFKDTGMRLYIISVLWRPAVPSIFQKE